MLAPLPLLWGLVGVTDSWLQPPLTLVVGPTTGRSLSLSQMVFQIINKSLKKY